MAPWKRQKLVTLLGRVQGNKHDYGFSADRRLQESLNRAGSSQREGCVTALPDAIVLASDPTGAI